MPITHLRLRASYAGLTFHQVDGPKLANMLEFGKSPILPPERLKAIGYTVAAYPLTLLSASAKAMQESLQLLKRGLPTESQVRYI